MTVNYWHLVVQEVKTKVKAHRLLAIGQQASGLTVFEKKDLEIKEKQLVLAEESRRRSEEADKSKAKAVAESKYDVILTISIELEEFLDKVPDWKEAARGQVITAMKSLETWSQRYHDLHTAYGDFKVAISTCPLNVEAEKVEEIMQNITNKYTEVTTAVQKEDKTRELYSLAGASTEQVKLPKFGGAAGEDFSIFKSKLLLALEKNRVAASDKVEKLRSCLSGQALALVPENSKDFSAALEVLADAFGNPEKVLVVRLNDLKMST